jgi:hypothetical protein
MRREAKGEREKGKGIRGRAIPRARDAPAAATLLRSEVKAIPRWGIACEHAPTGAGQEASAPSPGFAVFVHCCAFLWQWPEARGERGKEGKGNPAVGIACEHAPTGAGQEASAPSPGFAVFAHCCAFLWQWPEAKGKREKGKGKGDPAVGNRLQAGSYRPEARG